MNEDDHHKSETIDIFEAILLLKTKKEVENFLKDLCTPKEIYDLKERWKICQLLDKGDLSYREIHKITAGSLTTIGRVARFLKDEPNDGYRTILKRIKQKGGP